jgi:subfamily B ATP-binding cassette protein MsbA
MALWASWKLTLLVLIVFPPSIVAIALLGRVFRRRSHRGQERMADLASLLQESVQGIRVIKSFSMESRETERLDSILKDFRQNEIAFQRFRGLAGPVSELIAVIVSGLLLFIGGRMILTGESSLTLGRFFVFMGAALSVMEPVKRISRGNAVIQDGLAAAERVRRLLGLEPSVVEHPDPTSLYGFREAIEFEDVHFSYIDGEKVLRGLNLRIERGEIVALVGRSGVGKTTVAGLLARFQDPDSGRVTIDGVDLRRVAIASLRGLMGIVTQDTVLFNDTVYNNIAYGGMASRDLEDPGVDRQVRGAAEAANALGFITNLPEGMSTVIGEQGHSLSGGQRQRLAIARAMFMDPEILLLDEATSSLDAESERLVQEAMERLMAGRTTLLIAHRLSSIMVADRIVLLQDGKVGDSGTHEDLLGSSCEYRQLYGSGFLRNGG